MKNKLWLDIRLTKDEMDFLENACSQKNKKDFSNGLAGNISRSEELKDSEDNWFFHSALKKPTERMFYQDWNNYYKYVIDQEEPPPEFELKSLWVNYQKENEFNPIHSHTYSYSFVIFMKIPTHWEEQHALPFSANSNAPSASDFQFVWTMNDTEHVETTNFTLSPEDEGRMLFFPAWLKHQVYPFYECEEERITISGNINIVGEKIPEKISEWKEGVKRELSDEESEQIRETAKIFEKILK